VNRNIDMAGEDILGLESLGIWTKSKELVLVVYQQVLVGFIIRTISGFAILHAVP